MEILQAKITMKQSLITSAIMIAAITAAIALSSCVTTTYPDGTKTKQFDSEAFNPWIEIAAEYYIPEPTK